MCDRFFYFLFLVMLFVSYPVNGQERTITNFEANLEGGDLTFSMCLPSSIQQKLKGLKILPDPFTAKNEELVQWVSENNWTLKASFNIPKEEIEQADNYIIKLSRVDTFAEIYLNGGFVGRTCNYFRDFSFEVKSFLVPGENTLVIRLLSPTRQVHSAYLSSGFNYPADNDRATIHYSPFVRTSPYHFGWDWGPRLITMGIDSPVVLSRERGPRIQQFNVLTDVDGNRRTASIHYKWQVDYPEELKEVTISVLDPKGRVLPTLAYTSKDSIGGVTLELNDPELWWPRSMGKQPLYTAIISLRDRSGQLVHTRQLRFGIRSIQLVQKTDKIGESFGFLVNGCDFYAKGANYLPHDRRFRGEGDPYTLRKLFEDDILPVHINMLRVWGGGEYESEEFYHLTDSLGILVWQDFPFACSTYPNDPTFRDNVREELAQNISRISNHPSIALFCGNNEIEEGINHWGWKNKYGYSDSVWEKMKSDYDDFFRRFLPSLVSTYAPNVDYIHGSPFSSNWGRPKSLLSGDSHYWGLWFGGEDFDTFDYNYGRFASEFGFQSFPELKTLKTIVGDTPVDSLEINHPLLKHRQRSFIGNQTISDYMKEYYEMPKDFLEYIYLNQLLQGHGMDYAIRAIRRGYPTNRGLLFWQLNDVWPAISWSSIDYYGNWKAMHYYLKGALAPVVVDIHKNAQKYLLTLVSDTPIEDKIQVKLKALDFKGNVLWEEVHQVSPPKGGPFALQIETLDSTRFEVNKGQIVVQIEAQASNGSILASHLYYPLKPKDLTLARCEPIVKVHASNGQMELKLSSNNLVKDLYIQTPSEWQGAKYSDNFFDLLPHEVKVITITHPSITETSSLDDLTFYSLNNL